MVQLALQRHRDWAVFSDDNAAHIGGGADRGGDGDPAGAGAGHGPRLGLSGVRELGATFARVRRQPTLVPGISLL